MESNGLVGGEGGKRRDHKLNWNVPPRFSGSSKFSQDGWRSLIKWIQKTKLPVPKPWDSTMKASPKKEELAWNWLGTDAVMWAGNQSKATIQNWLGSIQNKTDPIKEASELNQTEQKKSPGKMNFQDSLLLCIWPDPPELSCHLIWDIGANQHGSITSIVPSTWALVLLSLQSWLAGISVFSLFFSPLSSFSFLFSSFLFLRFTTLKKP